METQRKLPIRPLFNYSCKQRLLHFYRRFQNLSINEINHLLYFKQETTPPIICVPISLLLVIFHVAHSHDLSGHPGRYKTQATITENYYFANTQTWIEILTQNCLNCQTSKSMPNLLVAPQQLLRNFTILQSSYFSGHKGPNFPVFPNGNFYVCVSVDSFTHYILLHPSTKNDATKALTVFFYHWIVKFGIPDILVTDKGNEYFNSEFAHLCRTYNVQFKPRTPYAPCSNGFVENINRKLNTFLCTVLDTQYDT